MAEPQPGIQKMSSRDTRSLRQNEQAYLRIKEMILLGEIAPLAMIEEKTLMAELGLGRTPIREALLRLSYEDLVAIIPFRGMFAAGIDMSDLDEIMEMRIPLECLAVRLVCERASNEDLAELRRRVESADVAGLCARGDVRGLYQFDHDFHCAIVDMARNRFLDHTLAGLRDAAWRFHVVYYRRHGADARDYFNNYREVLEALEQRDPDAAQGAIMRHFERQRPTP